MVAKAESEIQVKLKLTGQQEFNTALRKLGDSANNLGKSFTKFADSLKNVAKNIGLVTAAATAAGAAIFSVTKNNALQLFQVFQRIRFRVLHSRRQSLVIRKTKPCAGSGSFLMRSANFKNQEQASLSQLLTNLIQAF